MLVGASAAAGTVVASWGGQFGFGANGNFSANGAISASGAISAGGAISGGNISGASITGTGYLTGAGLVLNLSGAGTLQEYPSGGLMVRQYVGGWYDSWNSSGGLRQWVGGNSSLMTLDGGGNWACGGQANVGAGLVVGSANGINYSALSGYWIGWGWNASGLFVYVNSGNQWYVPHGYAVQSGQSNITSWAYNANGNIYATESGGTQRVWATSSSDRRLKSNITKSEIDALGAINRLNVVSCDMKFDLLPEAPTHHWDCALIADEVEPVIPIAYVAPIKYKERNDAEEKESLAYLRELPLIATLVKAVQQLTERVEAAEARLKVLEP